MNDEDIMAEVRLRVYYEGDVQGVGFRYRASQLAREYAVDGFVRNLSDGRVELAAEGEETEVREFLDRVRESMSLHIRKVTETVEPVEHSTRGFRIR